jgi:hypothetical protein
MWYSSSIFLLQNEHNLNSFAMLFHLPVSMGSFKFDPDVDQFIFTNEIMCYYSAQICDDIFWHFCWLPYLYTCSLYENASFIIVSAETEYISRLLTKFICLYTYEFWLSLCKIVRRSVIVLLPLCTGQILPRQGCTAPSEYYMKCL